MAYLTKKKELEKIIMNDKEWIQESMISKRKKNCLMNENKMVGVSKTKNGKYTARIKHPISKKDIWLGTFGSHEEAATAYSTKKRELEEEVKGKKGIQGAVCHNRIKKVVDRLGKKMVGVNKMSSGKYNARIIHPITRKEIWLGSFRSHEEAAMAYLTKKKELEKEVKGKNGIQGFKEVVDQFDQCLGNSVSEPCLENKDSSLQVDSRKVMLGKKMVGVNRMKSGKYYARIIHPITKKEIWLGSFRCYEEAAMVYLAKKTEFEKELEGTEEMDRAVSKDNEIGKSTDHCPIEESNHEPCLRNQDSAIQTEPIDSLDGRSAIRMEIPIEKNGGSAGIELSSDPTVWPEPGAEILLRSESGEPIMDSHGFFLGNFSWIDDLSLPSWSFKDDLS